MSGDEPPRKRICFDISSACIIHCTNDSGELTALHDIQSWESPLKAVGIRQYKPVLDLLEKLKDGEVPGICYHRKCRSIFTVKKDLDRILKTKGTTGNCELSMRQEKRSSRGPPAKVITYDRICIFFTIRKASMERDNKQEKS